jgi:hypothetical protein
MLFTTVINFKRIKSDLLYLITDYMDFVDNNYNSEIAVVAVECWANCLAGY